MSRRELRPAAHAGSRARWRALNAVRNLEKRHLQSPLCQTKTLGDRWEHVWTLRGRPGKHAEWLGDHREHLGERPAWVWERRQRARELGKQRRKEPERVGEASERVGDDRATPCMRPEHACERGEHSAFVCSQPVMARKRLADVPAWPAVDREHSRVRVDRPPEAACESIFPAPFSRCRGATTVAPRPDGQSHQPRADVLTATISVNTIRDDRISNDGACRVRMSLKPALDRRGLRAW